MISDAVSRDKLPVLDHFRFQHAPIFGGKLNYFGSFRVLVKPETEVVQNRQFISTAVVYVYREISK